MEKITMTYSCDECIHNKVCSIRDEIKESINGACLDKLADSFPDSIKIRITCEEYMCNIREFVK